MPLLVVMSPTPPSFIHCIHTEAPIAWFDIALFLWLVFIIDHSYVIAFASLLYCFYFVSCLKLFSGEAAYTFSIYIYIYIDSGFSSDGINLYT